MLVLTRKEGETIAIGDEIEVRVLRIDGDQIRLGIVAPRQLTVLRGELLKEINQETTEAAASKTTAAAAKLKDLAAIARMLPTVLALTIGMVAATALVGAVLAWATPVDGLTAYLATTPGGLFAVLSTAADAGSDVTYVLAVQLCRLLVILALTPLLARWLSTRSGR